MKVLLFFNYLFLLSFLNSCLLPPTSTKPKYLNQNEFTLLTNITEAKNLAQSGRLDAAEILYRRILKQSPKQIVAQNDLAYICLLENRIEEAEYLLKQVIITEPKFIPARINYARLLILQDKFDKALAEYFYVEDLLNNYTIAELTEITGEQIPPNFINVIYRLMASAYYLNGNYDDAICYSQLSSTRLLVASEMDLHMRLLLSLELNNEAASYGASIVSLENQEIPNVVKFDYALSLSASDQGEKAKLVLDKVLEIGGLGQLEMAAARFLQFSLETNQSNLLLIKENFTENNRKDCEIKNFDVDQYWPYNTKIKIAQAQNKLCEKDATE